MVNIIENRAYINGTVKSVSREADARGFFEVIFELEGSADADDLPNLARADEGKDITIKMQKDFLDQNDVAPGAEISFSVRKAFGQVYFTQD